MILLDTNVVIYLHDNMLDDSLIEKLRNSSLDTCNIIVAEILGYRRIDKEDARYFENLFSTMNNHLFNKEVTTKVIELRRTINIKLPDAIIAATALVNGLELWTHNVEDFKKVQDLVVFDPIAS
jgi:predicted nucleic acid-binding protein